MIPEERRRLGNVHLSRTCQHCTQIVELLRAVSTFDGMPLAVGCKPSVNRVEQFRFGEMRHRSSFFKFASA
jgi:hypothetical protein